MQIFLPAVNSGHMVWPNLSGKLNSGCLALLVRDTD